MDDGVLRFGDGPEPWPPDGLRGLLRGRWIEINWHRSVAEGIHAIATYDNATSSRLGDAARVRWTEHLRAIAFAEGPVCEVAAGPGGGWMPRILTWNPGARVVVNDWSPGVLRLWKDFLGRARPDVRLCFAAFDAARCTFRPGTLSAVTSFGGLENVQGGDPDPMQRAIECMYAALRPGGFLLAQEHTFDAADWAHLGTAQRSAWNERFWDLTLTKGERLQRAGFEVVDRQLAPGKTMDPGNDGIAVTAAEFGVILHSKNEMLFARRP